MSRCSRSEPRLTPEYSPRGQMLQRSGGEATLRTGRTSRDSVVVNHARHNSSNNLCLLRPTFLPLAAPTRSTIKEGVGDDFGVDFGDRGGTGGEGL
jgi:hypothetical protein